MSSSAIAGGRMVQKSIALKTQGAFGLPAEDVMPTLRGDFRAM
jgi:hypothetical protein